MTLLVGSGGAGEEWCSKKKPGETHSLSPGMSGASGATLLRTVLFLQQSSGATQYQRVINDQVALRGAEAVLNCISDLQTYRSFKPSVFLTCWVPLRLISAVKESCPLPRSASFNNASTASRPSAVLTASRGVFPPKAGISWSTQLSLCDIPNYDTNPKINRVTTVPLKSRKIL